MRHPRRDLLEAAIRHEPGITFRELMRGTGLAAGVLHHHLRALEGQGRVTRRRLGNRVHFFGEGRAHEGNWTGVVARRSPDLRALHDWLCGQGIAARKDILGHAASTWGWKSGATHHRLDRLVRAGLVARVPDGHGRGYSLRTEPQGADA